jgi:hypothetical protein
MLHLNNQLFRDTGGNTTGISAQSVTSSPVCLIKDDTMTYLKDYTKHTDQLPKPEPKHRAFEGDDVSLNNIYSAFGAERDENDCSAWIYHALVVDGGEGVLWMSEGDNPKNRIYVCCEIMMDLDNWKKFVQIRYRNENDWSGDWNTVLTPKRSSWKSICPALVVKTIIEDIAKGGQS